MLDKYGYELLEIKFLVLVPGRPIVHELVNEYPVRPGHYVTSITSREGRVSDVHFGLTALHDLVGVTVEAKHRNAHCIALLLK